MDINNFTRIISTICILVLLALSFKLDSEVKNVKDKVDQMCKRDGMVLIETKSIDNSSEYYCLTILK